MNIATFVPVQERAAAAARPRIDSIDLLRGAIMIVMALDHARDYLGAGGLNPRDVMDPALFLTRWITHFCAPLFIFLAGVSAYLYGTRGRRVGEVSRFLLTRGLWLVVMEFTVMRVAWSFGFNLSVSVANVIWALGASMVVLSALVYLPRWAIAAIGVALIGGHNLFDGVHAANLGSAGWIWTILHERGVVPLGAGARLFVLYPLVPWIGVMAAGYALAPVFQFDQAVRRRWLAALGLMITSGFVVLRASNLYGDPASWVAQSNGVATVLSFVNLEKYPPSLLYLAMTIGPGLLFLAAFDSARGRVTQIIITYGRVPFLYYVAHIVLIHALAVALAFVMLGDASWLLGGPPSGRPANFGLSLPSLYLAWLIVVVALYPLCRWFANIKQRRSEWWLSYL